MNPLFNILNGGMQPQNPMINMIAQLNQFGQMFRGDPKQQAQQLLSSGRMSQEQFNHYSQMATQIQNMMINNKF